MSTLPDLTTSNVGYIAYWNAINQGGVGSIKASQALSDSNIQNYTLYDNGFVATYQISFSNAASRDITVRVKQDGWFVAYMDRTNTYNQSVGTGTSLPGYWDLINDWSDYGSEVNTFPNNKLERSIHSLQSQLSNSGSITYNSSDVGLYNYEFTSASTSTMFGSHVGNDSSETSGLIYTSGTNVLYASAQGAGYNAGSHSLSFEGTTIESGNNVRRIGSLDILSDGLISNPDTEYDMNLTSGTVSTTGSVLTMWS